MSIDVEALTNAVFHVYGNVTKRGASIGPDRPGPREGYRPREFWQEDARLIAAEYARLVPAEDEGRLREAARAMWYAHTEDERFAGPVSDDPYGDFERALLAPSHPHDGFAYDGCVCVCCANARALAATQEPTP